jgi:hypothetical protein
MLKKNIFAVGLIILIALGMSAIVYPDPKTSYIVDGGDIIAPDMVTFLVRHPAGYTISTLEGVEPGAQQQIILFGASGFDINQPVPATGATLHATLHHCIYTSNGRFLYTVSMGGTVYLVEKLGNPLTPRWYNGEGVIINEAGIVQPPQTPTAFQSPAVNHLVITTGVRPDLPLIESAGNIYFWKGNELHYLPINSAFSNYDRTLSKYNIYTYDVYDNRIYILGAYLNTATSKMVLDFFEWTSSGPEILHTAQAYESTTSVGAAGHVQVINNDLFYIYGQYQASNFAPATLSGIYNRTAFIEILPAVPPFLKPGATVSMMAISRVDNYMAVGRNNDGIEIVSINHKKEVLSSSPFETTDLAIEYKMISRQNEYYNNTPLDVRVYMQLTGTLNHLNGAKKIVEDRTFELLLYGPEDMLIGRYQIPETAWKYETKFTGINFNQVGTVSRTVEFQPPNNNWQPGKYTFRLTEYSIDRGQYQIGQHSIRVANESGSLRGGSVSPDDVSTTDIISSSAFKALMIICIPAIGLGIVAGLPGALVGMVLGVFLSFAMGLLSLVWVILTTFAITASFAAFARDMITGKGGA